MAKRRGERHVIRSISRSGVSNLRPRAGYYPSTYLNTHTLNRSQTHTRKTRRKVRPEGAARLIKQMLRPLKNAWANRESVAACYSARVVPVLWHVATARYTFSSASLRTDRETRSDGEHKYDILTSGGIRRTSSSWALDDVYKRNMSMILLPPARMLSAD